MKSKSLILAIACAVGLVFSPVWVAQVSATTAADVYAQGSGTNWNSRTASGLSYYNILTAKVRLLKEQMATATELSPDEQTTLTTLLDALVAKAPSIHGTNRFDGGRSSMSSALYQESTGVNDATQYWDKSNEQLNDLATYIKTGSETADVQAARKTLSSMVVKNHTGNLESTIGKTQAALNDAGPNMPEKTRKMLEGFMAQVKANPEKYVSLDAQTIVIEILQGSAVDIRKGYFTNVTDTLSKVVDYFVGHGTILRAVAEKFGWVESGTVVPAPGSTEAGGDDPGTPGGAERSSPESGGVGEPVGVVDPGGEE